jgi:HEAT repeat protein
MPVRTLSFMTLALAAAAAVAAQQTPRPRVQPRPQVFTFPTPDFEWERFALDFEHERLLDDFSYDFDFQFPLQFDFQFPVQPFEFAQPEFQLPQEWSGPLITPGAGQHGFGRRGAMHDLPDQDSPTDSAYRAARETLNRHEYRRAAEMFAGFAQKYPQSRYAAAALYWQAFALYRIGSTPELERALQVLDEQRQKHPTAADDAEVSGLTARVLGALAARGNGTARQRLEQQAASGVQSCDREDMEVRAEALSALVQSDPASAAPVLRRTLARRDACSTPLRRRAVYLLGREGVGGTAEDLLEVATNDPDQSVRADALGRLAQFPGEVPVRLLDRLLTSSSDEHTQRAVLMALRRSEHPEADQILRRAIERTDLSERVRADAIRTLLRRSATAVTVPDQRGQVSRKGGDPTLSNEDAALLRGLYPRSDSRAVKSAILETLARGGGTANDQWLAELVRNTNEDLRYRTMALGRLRRSDIAVAELSRLYDGLSERELRNELIRILGSRDEPEATDKLFEIARTGTDPSVRRNAINALSRKKDERTTKLLLELVEKQP